jgi:PilZ domain
MSPHTERRHHPRISVEWPLLYSTPTISAHGTVIDVSALAWRVEGSMPVHAGIKIAMQVWPNKSMSIEIQEARVLWAVDRMFALEIDQVSPQHESALLRLQQDTLGQEPTHMPRDHQELSNPVDEFASFSRVERGGVTDPGREDAAGVPAHAHLWIEPGVFEEALLQDVSTMGCKFSSRAFLEPGSTITLMLFCTDGQPAITLPGTKVCWAKGTSYGVQFPPMTTGERRRVEQMVERVEILYARCALTPEIGI